MFPVNAFLAKRAVTATYSAKEDTFCLMFTWEGVDQLSRISPVFSDYLNRRTMQFLDLSRRAIQVAYSSQTLAEQSLEKPLSDVIRAEPFSCLRTTPLKQVLEVMNEHRIGSMIVVDERHRVEGILTRQDVLAKVALAQIPLQTPIEAVMISPVVHTPQRGRAITQMYLTAAMHVLGNDSFEYLRTFHGDHSGVLEFATEIDGKHVNGVDIIAWNNEGKIIDFKVMLRPYKAIEKVRESMLKQLEAL